MTQTGKDEIRGLTLPMIRTFIVCTIAICGSVIGAGVYVKSSFNNHELRIGELETFNKTQCMPLQKDVISLLEWRKQVTAYYMPPAQSKNED